MAELLSNDTSTIDIVFPPMEYCTDNADMIAFLAMKKAENKDIKKSMDFSAYSRGITL